MSLTGENCSTCQLARAKSTNTDCTVCLKESTADKPFPGWRPNK